MFQVSFLTLLSLGALDKQRQMYEEKIEELRNQMGPRQNMERASSMGSFSSGYGSSRVSWCEDRLGTVVGSITAALSGSGTSSQRRDHSGRGGGGMWARFPEQRLVIEPRTVAVQMFSGCS